MALTAFLEGWLGPLVDSRPRYWFVAFDLPDLAVFRREDVCRSYRNRRSPLSWLD
ncbi:hypothetical protein WN943_010917 [Citrus x changshan-huyou]